MRNPPCDQEMTFLHILALFVFSLLPVRKNGANCKIMRHSSPPSGGSLSLRRSPSVCGFTLLELLAVMAVIALLVGLTVPAMSGLGKAGNLSSGARMVSNMLASARTEAITRRAVTRMAIATDWPGDAAAANYRKMSIWLHEPAAVEPWKQIAPWVQLPESVAFEPASPGYVTSGDPAGYLLAGTQNSFTATIRGRMVTMKFVEFVPSGAARLPQATGSDVWLALAPGHIVDQSMAYAMATSSGSPVNWAKISANTLTGRLRVSQP